MLLVIKMNHSRLFLPRLGGQQPDRSSLFWGLKTTNKTQHIHQVTAWPVYTVVDCSAVKLSWGELGFLKHLSTKMTFHPPFTRITASREKLWTVSVTSSGRLDLSVEAQSWNRYQWDFLWIAVSDSFGDDAGNPAELLWYRRSSLSLQFINISSMSIACVLSPPAASACLALRLSGRDRVVVTLSSGQLVPCLVTWQGNICPASTPTQNKPSPPSAVNLRGHSPSLTSQWCERQLHPFGWQLTNEKTTTVCK